ncbi:phosphotransferase [Actinocrinis puniceicyclus]|uniref:Phosphotransferase n=1 Tax=Actinocrinis puniceicyclus TaxID=977794 RepID=A0A8J7WNT8_9ACTN|nr:phosphotransferase [Actinocrinis puniceicyclus]MBS2963137.1 phosphotransferase [Actinocrinis puniceicyclus]
MSHLVHGLGPASVAPDWPPLTLDEVDAVLRRYPQAGGARALTWRSPRPLSAAGLVATARGGALFVKRHHRDVRTLCGLQEEHSFLAHLRRGGGAVVGVLADEHGNSAVAAGEWTYEVHTVGDGDDLYRDAISWSPFTRIEHAHAAGRALAELHRAAHGYDAPPRAARQLTAGFSVFAAADPLTAVERYAAARPALAEDLCARAWRADIERWHLPFHARLASQLSALEPLWTHNDFHASNLLWRGAKVSAVLDFGLCDRAFAVHDLATAIERNAVRWLELERAGAGAVHGDAALALIDGYQQVRKLTPAERAALPDLLALCHADYALSEIEYFRGVTGSAANAELAYRYLVDHTAWFAGPVGAALLDRLRAALDG